MYKEMTTSTRFQHHNQLVKENIIKMSSNAIVPNVYISSISYCIKMHKTALIKCDRKLFMQKILSSEHNLRLLRFYVIKLMLFVVRRKYADHKCD